MGQEGIHCFGGRRLPLNDPCVTPEEEQAEEMNFDNSDVKSLAVSPEMETAADAVMFQDEDTVQRV